MRLTEHAKKRWQERCAGLDPETEWRRAQRIGKKKARRIRESCPHHANHVRMWNPEYYYRVSRFTNVVWVVAAGPLCEVVTVWRWA